MSLIRSRIVGLANVSLEQLYYILGSIYYLTKLLPMAMKVLSRIKIDSQSRMVASLVFTVTMLNMVSLGSGGWREPSHSTMTVTYPTQTGNLAYVIGVPITAALVALFIMAILRKART